MKEKIFAVHSSQVKDFLPGIIGSNALNENDLRCYCCEKKITISNFGAITRFKGKLVFACNQDTCLECLATLSKD